MPTFQFERNAQLIKLNCEKCKKETLHVALVTIDFIHHQAPMSLYSYQVACTICKVQYQESADLRKD